MTLTSCVSPVVDCKTSPNDSLKEQEPRDEFSTEKTKLMVNSLTNTSADNINMNDEKLEEVTRRYFGAIFQGWSSTSEVQILIAVATPAMDRPSQNPP
ncbi:hypothetical protein DPMN_108475 [Dreissena polymorpha]|uniref:Uncharacterized protein n=1 Tax=Dreissena polymorpha TaxID=45954 RepID=A0A9D4K8L1_DREPO|nr:hypothetical protein DPMN_108475 [Dreissena polymorpha]